MIDQIFHYVGISAGFGLGGFALGAASFIGAGLLTGGLAYIPMALGALAICVGATEYASQNDH